METGRQIMRRAAACGGLAALLAASGCASIEPRAERWTPPAPGSSWEIAQRNTGSYGKDVQLRVTRGDGVWQGAPVITLSNSLGVTTMVAPNGHWIAIVGRDGKPMSSWDPPLGFQYPLTVGSAWSTPYRLTLGNGKTIPYTLSCKTESHEKVTVQAGTLDAFKVVCTTDIGNHETYWTHPDLGVFVKTKLVRDDKSPFGPGTQEAELVSLPAKRP